MALGALPNTKWAYIPQQSPPFMDKIVANTDKWFRSVFGLSSVFEQKNNIGNKKIDFKELKLKKN